MIIQNCALTDEQRDNGVLCKGLYCRKCKEHRKGIKKGYVDFNHSVRKLCKCGHPEGFCKHTIEVMYRELCPDSDKFKTKENIWQHTRTMALDLTHNRNLINSYREQIKELTNRNRFLETRNNELSIFKKETRHPSILLRRTYMGK